jgi:hypothetical protein
LSICSVAILTLTELRSDERPFAGITTVWLSL